MKLHLAHLGQHFTSLVHLISEHLFQKEGSIVFRLHFFQIEHDVLINVDIGNSHPNLSIFSHFLQDIYKHLKTNCQLPVLSFRWNGHIKQETLNLFILINLMSTIISVSQIYLLFELLHTDRVHLFFLIFFQHFIFHLVIVVLVDGVDCLTIYQKLNFLLNLHLSSDKFNQHNCIDRVNLLREESFTKKSDLVETLKCQL